LSMRVFRSSIARPVFVAISLLVGVPASLPAKPRASAAPSGATAQVSVLAVRSWTAPANTRIVIDFSAPVSSVMPDSGDGRNLVISVPGEAIARADSVPPTLRIVDGAVDSVQVATSDSGARFHVFMHDSTHFRAFSLPPEQDKPFRIVVDVDKRGGEAAEDRRLASIAAIKKKERIRIVMVDAGHGGEDTGARGPGGVREKDVTLAVARALVDEINSMSGLRALLTRNGDWFIPLKDRYRIAEKAKADVFISIHANSSKRRGSGSGTEVYFLSSRGASDQADADLADLENAADLVGGVPQHAEDDLVNILYDVKRSSAMQKSQLLAESLLEQISSDRLEARGVKQAGFVVLKSVEFPSVLVEVAFINNPRESKLLKDPNFQKSMGRQLASGVRDYFQRAGIGLASPPAGIGSGPTSSGRGQ